MNSVKIFYSILTWIETLWYKVSGLCPQWNHRGSGWSHKLGKYTCKTQEVVKALGEVVRQVNTPSKQQRALGVLKIIKTLDLYATRNPFAHAI